MIAQIAEAVFGDFPPGFYFVVATTGDHPGPGRNTAFNGFPVLGSILAQDGYLPRQLGSRGDRLAYSNGIVFLAVLRDHPDRRLRRPDVTRLIQLYIVGVFVSFNLSQLGHDPALDPAPEDRDGPGRAAPDVPLPRRSTPSASA